MLPGVEGQLLALSVFDVAVLVSIARWQIASQHHVTGVGEHPGIPGRIKSDWVGAYFRNRWANVPGLRTK